VISLQYKWRVWWSETSSEPEPDPMELDLMVWFQVWGAPLNLTSVRFEVLGFQSKNRTEPDYGSTTPDCPHQGQTTIHQTGLKDLETCSSSRQITFENHLDTCHPGFSGGQIIIQTEILTESVSDLEVPDLFSYYQIK